MSTPGYGHFVLGHFVPGHFVPGQFVPGHFVPRLGHLVLKIKKFKMFYLLVDFIEIL